ncbi:MAG: dual specificity protein phosphatase family protein [Erysipelotrichaceae bacterium]|nr:dual specificity protein phosphatase family protein [Erysipelotrichaceae bacterium]
MNVYVYSREQLINKIKKDFPFNTAVISFYDEGSEPLDLKGRPIAEISKCINDIRWVEHPDRWHRHDFEDVARFICKCIEHDYDIICQCEFGVSRSSACAMAIKEFAFGNGIDIFKNYNYYPNQIFFNNIYECLVRMK